jgi:cardiolipin synthase A/B
VCRPLRFSITTPSPRNVVIALLIAAVLIAAVLALAQDQETLRVRTPLAADDPQFPGYLAHLLGGPLTSGNVYVVHTNGKAAFPAMLAAIAGARHRVSFETYIYESGETADMFTAAFEAAARRGVDVRLVLDSIGAQKIDPAHVTRLKNAGCQVVWFNQVNGFELQDVNYRTHRKSLVVDGTVAFVGGIGIGDAWLRNTERGPVWRDTQIEVRGPAATYIEGSFNENWIESGEVVEPAVLANEGAEGGSAPSIVVWSSPQSGANGTKLLYLLAIASARTSLDIESPYLITDESTEWSLADARRRGVRVRLVVEGDITDAKPVKFAGRAGYERLLEHGIEIYEYKPAMLHSKVMVVDDVLAVVGSANFDNRSLELNDELSVAVFDRSLAARLLEDMEDDISRARHLDLPSWRARPLHIRAREQLWSFFGEVF